MGRSTGTLLPRLALPHTHRSRHSPSQSPPCLLTLGQWHPRLRPEPLPWYRRREEQGRWRPFGSSFHRECSGARPPRLPTVTSSSSKLVPTPPPPHPAPLSTKAIRTNHHQKTQLDLPRSPWPLSPSVAPLLHSCGTYSSFKNLGQQSPPPRSLPRPLR